MSTIAAAFFFPSLPIFNRTLSHKKQEKEKKKTGNNEEDGNTERLFMAQSSGI